MEDIDRIKNLKSFFAFFDKFSRESLILQTKRQILNILNESHNLRPLQETVNDTNNYLTSIDFQVPEQLDPLGNAGSVQILPFRLP